MVSRHKSHRARTHGTVARSPVASGCTLLILFLLCEPGSADEPFQIQAAPEFEELWESAAVASYSPEDLLIPADAGTWLIADTVSEFPECGATPHRGTISMVSGSKALTLMSEDSNSECSDNIWVAFQELAPVDLNLGFAISVSPDTIISFDETGALINPQSAPDTCVALPCGDTIALTLQVLPSGSELVYVLQRAPDAVPNTRHTVYREIFLDPDAGSYQRNLMTDLMTIPNFDPAGAEVRFIEFAVDEHGSATLDNLKIAPGTLADTDGDGVPNDQDAFPNDPNEWDDTDSDGIGNNADTDDDGDIMPDDYEVANGLDPLDAADATADADGDGFTNLEEFQAGTDPQNPDNSPAGTKVPVAITILLSGDEG